MDIFSHGLWGSIIWGRKNRKSFWTAFLFGVGPDLFSFGIFTFARILSFENRSWGKPELSSIPEYVNTLYDITHSFIIFFVVFAIVWMILGKPLWEMLAWPFHIFLDIFTHSTEFFPTPYLWPLFHPVVNGVSWGTPTIFFTNFFFLVLIYTVYWYRKRKYKRTD